MDKTIVTLNPKLIVGISARTCNAIEADWQNSKAKIFPCVKKYFGEQLANQISHRVNPGTTYCAYTNYESDHNSIYLFYGRKSKHYKQCSRRI